MREGEPNLEERITPEPFLAGEALKEGEFSIRELNDNPDKVVRTESMVGSVKETTAHYKKIKDLFAEMKNDYGVNVPDMDTVIAKSEKGKDRVFMFVDKIEGKDLGELENLPETAKEKFESFYAGILQSVFDNYRKQKPFFCDFKRKNIVYGHKTKDKKAEDDFFLADVGGGFQYGGYLEYHGQIIKSDYDQSFTQAIENAKTDLQHYERMFGENIALNRIRQKIEEMETSHK